MTDKYEHLAAALPKAEKPMLWGTPDPGTFFEYPYRALLPNMDLLIHRQELDDRDRLLGFALVHMTDLSGEDQTVVEIDTRHGEVHLHQYRQGNIRIGPRRSIHRLRSQRDIEEGYDLALDVITEKWAEHKRRWQRGY